MQELTESMFLEHITKNQETAVVVFSKEGCPICQQVLPCVEALEQDYAAQPIYFYHVNGLKEKALMERLSLKGVPQVLFFKKGESRGKYAGLREAETYKEKIEALLQE